jgi:WD40 repeat protein
VGEAVAASEVGPRPITGHELIVLCDQQSQSVILTETGILRAHRERRLDLTALWSWSPASYAELADLLPSRSWINVSEAKQTETPDGTLLLTCASGGMAVAFNRSRGSTYWATNVPGSSNLHSLEMLPDGNIAVAASTGGYIRLYTASQGPRSSHYVQHPLPGAHAGQRLLWALGTSELHALAVDGTRAAPGVTLRRRLALPDEDGHDLAPVIGAPDDRWVTTGRHVYRVSLTTGTFTRATAPNGIDRAHVKSISQHPATGQVIMVSPDDRTSCSWCSSRVDFADPNRQDALIGTSVYKARWWL